jgi:protein-S-isoprenylcysteine O-methyltransferase Ste14
VVLLWAAGTVWWWNAWVCFGLGVIHQVGLAVYLNRTNPALLGKRGEVVKSNTQRFDLWFVVLYPLLALSTSYLAGTHVGRVGWSPVSSAVPLVGLAFYLFAAWVGAWAMASNRFFEATVRIQDGHEVCSSGPYGYVRHPGYLAGVLGTLGYVLVLGSWWALIPSLLLCGVFVWRTAHEDRFLQSTLPGYSEFARQTKYRLFPFVW